MIITCQNCQTHYSLGAGVLGGGMKVQCHNCGNSWHQNPVQAAPPPPPPPPQPAAIAEPAPIAQAPAPEPEPLAPEPEPLAAEPEEVPEPMPEPEAAPESEAEAALEGEGEAAPEGEAEEAADAGADAEAGAEADALSPEQLDEMFGEDSESGAFQSLSDAEKPAEDTDEATPGDADGEIDLDSIPEPEPIPAVFSPDEEDPMVDDDLKKGGKGKVIGIAAAVVVIALGAGVFFGRSFIVDLWPGAADIYSMAGLGSEELGAGLDIRDVKSSREVEAGVDVLIVRGVVANVTEEDRMVPMIRVALYDSAGQEVQHVIAPPLKNRLQPGASIGFSAKLPEPSALARRLEVTFSEPDKTGG